MKFLPHVIWLLAFVGKEFISDFVRKMAEHCADKLARARDIYRRRRR